MAAHFAIASSYFVASPEVACFASAFALLNHGAYLGVVGFTMDAVTVRLSNLMAFDARAEGVWGCVPSLYPSALELVLSVGVRIAPFAEEKRWAPTVPDESFTCAPAVTASSSASIRQ